jgi:hypothetical protein
MTLLLLSADFSACQGHRFENGFASKRRLLILLSFCKILFADLFWVFLLVVFFHDSNLGRETRVLLQIGLMQLGRAGTVATGCTNACCEGDEIDVGGLG